MTSNESALDRSGWMTFAVVLFYVLGAINVIYGLAMIANSEFVVFTPGGAWMVDILIGWGLTTGNELARVVGIALAVVAAVNAFFVIPIYAVWGILAFAVAVMVIYALAFERASA